MLRMLSSPPEYLSMNRLEPPPLKCGMTIPTASRKYAPAPAVISSGHQPALAYREVQAHEGDHQGDLLLAQRGQHQERHGEPAPVLLEEDEGEEQEGDGERHRVELVQHRELERG